MFKKLLIAACALSCMSNQFGCDNSDSVVSIQADPRAKALASFQQFADSFYAQLLKDFQGKPSLASVRAAEIFRDGQNPLLTHYTTEFKISVEPQEGIVNPYKARLTYDSAVIEQGVKPKPTDFVAETLLFIGDGSSWHYIGRERNGKTRNKGKGGTFGDLDDKQVEQTMSAIGAKQ